jgi:hypothetical protein
MTCQYEPSVSRCGSRIPGRAGPKGPASRGWGEGPSVLAMDGEQLTPAELLIPGAVALTPARERSSVSGPLRALVAIYPCFVVSSARS